MVGFHRQFQPPRQRGGKNGKNSPYLFFFFLLSSPSLVLRLDILRDVHVVVGGVYITDM
jgi:hypothetical protein